MFDFARLSIPAAVFLTLTGCVAPHIVKERDALYCEAQGAPRGTDANVQCAIKHEAEQAEAGAGQEPAVTSMSAAPPPPPVHPGGVPQTLAKTVTTGVTATINFVISLKPDCSVNDIPVVRIDKQPEQGIVKLVRREDYARLSQNSFPAACANKKVPGIAVDYTSNKDYAGTDFIGFETVTKSVNLTVFKAPITVERRARPDD